MLNKRLSHTGSSQQIRRVDNPPREDEALAEGMNGRGSQVTTVGSLPS